MGGGAQRKDTTLAVAPPPPRVTGAALAWQQFTALNRKNLLIRGRAWKTNLLLVAQAVLFVVLIWGVDQGVKASRQREPAFSNVLVASPQPVAQIPDCSSSAYLRHGQPCYTLLYAPQGLDPVEAIVAGVVSNNVPPIPWEHVRGFQNASQIDSYLLAHPETVLGSVVFTVDGPTSIGFTLQTNSSVQWFKGSYQSPNLFMQIPLQSAVERELVRYLAAQSPPPSALSNASFPSANASFPSANAGFPSANISYGSIGAESIMGAAGSTGSSSTGSSSSRSVNGSALDWEVLLAQFPHPASQSPSMIGRFAPTFLFASIMFQFVLLVHDMVCEKESGVRRMMNTMGLRPLPFWASWMLFQGILAVVEACLLVGISYAFKFELFVDNDFRLSFLLLLLVSLAMTAFGFFVAAFLKKASAAVPAGFVMFVVAWVFLIVVAFGFPYSSKYSPVAVGVFSAMPWTLLAKGIQDLAAASEGRLQGLSWSERYSYCTPSPPSPQQLAAGTSYWQAQCVMPLGQMYWILAVQCGAYMVLAIYLDLVLPDGNGVKRSPLFLLSPRFWFPSKKRNLRPAQRALGAQTEWEEGLIVDPDVQQEAEKMRERCRRYLQLGVPVDDGWDSIQAVPATGKLPSSGADAAAAAAGGKPEGSVSGSSRSSSGVVHLEAVTPTAIRQQQQQQQQLEQEQQDKLQGAAGQAAGQVGSTSGTSSSSSVLAAPRRYALEMYGLRKVYRRGGLVLRRRKPFVAVRGNWLGIYEGECFCLLGPNGAGKSTTINCLTGVLPLTSGDALMYGESIASAAGMDAVRPMMGVCPQFDVLWDNLTGREHLMLFAAIKGLPRRGRAEEASRLLEDVKLSEAGGVRSGAYSGGMRRRLSVAIALLGDPKIVFLDEPSTGLDPISRRHLWDLIDRAKRDRAIVLTTHSMEEADVLGDRIGIMARGRLRCVGNSLRLKSRFGSGYRISVRVQGSSTNGDGAGAWAGVDSSSTSPTFSSWAATPQEQPQQPHLFLPTASTPTHHPASPSAATTPSSSGSRGGTGSSRQGQGAGAGAGASVAQRAQHAAMLAAAACEIEPEGGPQMQAGVNSAGSSGAGDGGMEAGGDPIMAAQKDRIKAVFWDRLGVKLVDETRDYLHFQVPYEHEDKLPLLFTYLKAHSYSLGIADLQLRLTPLEEVFCNITRKAELEHAQAEGRYEMLRLEDEGGIAIKVPVGAELIQSPGGHLYHIRWVQDESGGLRLNDYWRDPISHAVLADSGQRHPKQR